ncbi:MAG: phosphatidate cytidylyltransferase [Roseibium sp.]
MQQPETPPKKLSDLGLRLASAAVLGPLVLLIVYLGGIVFVLLMLVAAVLFLREWLAMTGTAAASPAALAGQGALAVLALLHILGLPEAGFAVVLAGAAAVYALGGFGKSGRWALEGTLYSGLALFALLVLRDGSKGLFVTFFLLLVVWATDIFAYFTGRAFGGPKLWVRVSPKKTWSGAIGGLVLATALGAGIAFVAGETEPVLWAMLAAGLSVVSQAGDLMESAIKRRFKVKDSSQLIPGHGGVMDRIDGLVAAAIFAVLVGLIAGGTLSDPVSGLGPA